MSLLNKLATKSDGVITASITASKTDLAGLSTASTDAITIKSTGTYSGEGGVTALNTLKGKTKSTVEAVVSGTVAEVKKLSTDNESIQLLQLVMLLLLMLPR